MTAGRLARVQALLSLVALGAVVWWALRQERPELPRDGDALGALLLAALVYAAGTAVRGERWHRILGRSGVPLTRADSYRLTVVGYMGNNTLPARGGDLLRVFLASPLVGSSRRTVLGTVVAERLLDAAALALIFATVAFGLLHAVDVPATASPLALALAAVAAGGVLFLLALAARRLGRRARAFLRPVALATRNLASAHGAGLLLLALAVWALEAAVYLAVARAVGIELAPVEALYVVALTNLFALVPAAPGYVGTFDAAVLLALASLAVPGSDALSYLLLLRFVLFVPITVLGLAFFLAHYGGWSAYRSARSAAP